MLKIDLEWCRVTQKSKFKSFKNANINQQINFQQINFDYWRPNKQLLLLQKNFNEKILIQFPSVPCSFCSILMFPTNAKWISKENNRIYPLTLTFPNEQPVEH